MRRLGSVLLILLLFMSFIPHARAAQALTLSVSVEVNGQSIISVTPDPGSPAYPSPRMELDRKATLDFVFSERGQYGYTIRQEGTDPGTVYDDTEYQVKLYLEPGAEGSLIGYAFVFKKGSDFKEEKILFVNRYASSDTDSIIVSRTIIYKEFDENGREIFTPVVQPVTLVRTKTINPDGTVTYGNWEIGSGEAPKVDSPNYPRWTPDKSTVPPWDIDLTDPKDETVYVFYKPDPDTDTKTVRRTITYTEYTPDGKEVSVPVVQVVTLIRDKKINPDGSVTYGKWEISGGDTTPIDSPPYPGWTPDREQVGVWRIDLTDPKDELIHVVYTPDPTKETKTVTRTVTYTEFTPDGREVSRTVTQKVTLVRSKTDNPDGSVSYGPWVIAEGDTSHLLSPEYPGWTPDMNRVPVWEIDLSDPKDELIHVVYVPKPVRETKVITRTVTYTEYTPDGKEVSVTVIQTAVLERWKTIRQDGSEEYSAWEVVSSETDSLISPPYSGWTPDIDKVGRWEIDLNDPQSVILHVVYVPTTTPAPLPDTGDEADLMLWGLLFVLSAAGCVLSLVPALRRKRR